MDIWRERTLEHRREHFKIVIDYPEWLTFSHMGEIHLRITHNGASHTVIGLLPEEIDKVIGVLQKHKESINESADENENTEE